MTSYKFHLLCQLITIIKQEAVNHIGRDSLPLLLHRTAVFVMKAQTLLLEVESLDGEGGLFSMPDRQWYVVVVSHSKWLPPVRRCVPVGVECSDHKSYNKLYNVAQQFELYHSTHTEIKLGYTCAAFIEHCIASL